VLTALLCACARGAGGAACVSVAAGGASAFGGGARPSVLSSGGEEQQLVAAFPRLRLASGLVPHGVIITVLCSSYASAIKHTASPKGKLEATHVQACSTGKFDH
jgi:hypothetical protein